jgi:hypothetical protein
MACFPFAAPQPHLFASPPQSFTSASGDKLGSSEHVKCFFMLTMPSMRTDFPFATASEIPGYEALKAEDKQVVATGLAEVDAASVAAHKKSFLQLTDGQQDALLTTLAEASKTKVRTFFHQFKELTVLGYFTSETVGKTVLHYDPVPGRFDACIPLAEVGDRAWTK